MCTGGIDEADIAVEGLEAAVAALERLTQMLAYNCRDDVTYGLRVRALVLQCFLTISSLPALTLKQDQARCMFISPSSMGVKMH